MELDIIGVFINVADISFSFILCVIQDRRLTPQRRVKAFRAYWRYVYFWGICRWK